jgi:hypothetical protein
MSRKTINTYRRTMQEAITPDNDNIYLPRNVCWRIGAECKHIHLILDYQSFSGGNGNTLDLKSTQLSA